MSMTIILAPNQREGTMWAKENGYTRRDSCIITPHGNSHDGRGLRSPEVRIAGEPKFSDDKLFSIGLCFIHNDDALAKWRACLEKLKALNPA